LPGTEGPVGQESLAEVFRGRRDADADFLAPKGPMPWKECDVYLLPNGRAVFPDGTPLFVRAGEPGAAGAAPIAETVFRRCGCREDDGTLTRSCAMHAPDAERREREQVA